MKKKKIKNEVVVNSYLSKEDYLKMERAGRKIGVVGSRATIVFTLARREAARILEGK